MTAICNKLGAMPGRWLSGLTRFDGWLLWLLLIGYGPVLSQPADSLTLFRQRIFQLYDGMSFAQVDFSVTKITLIDYPVGLAFARYDKPTGQRQILINTRYLYETYWEGKAHSQHKVEAQIKGMLAHEWAHHFMGHTFVLNTPLKEREADILTGRILFDNDSSRLEPDDSLPNRIRQMEERATQVSDWYDEQPTTTYHLGRQARRELIRKGFYTSLVLDPNMLERVIKRGVFIEAVWQDSLDRLKRKLVRIRQQKADSLISCFNQEIDSLLSVTTLDSSCRLGLKSLKLVYSPPESVTQPGSLSISQPASTSCLNNPQRFTNPTPLVDAMSSTTALYKPLSDFDSDKKYRLTYRQNSSPYDRFDAEAFYNFYYINEDGRKKMSRIDPKIEKTNWKFTDVEKFYFDLFKESNPPPALAYQLKYQEKNPIQINIFIPDSSVSYQASGNVQTATLESANSEQDKADFPLYFIIDESKYFLDRNRHLWVETLGAKPIRNKLFLQRFIKPSTP